MHFEETEDVACLTCLRLACFIAGRTLALGSAEHPCDAGCSTDTQEQPRSHHHAAKSGSWQGLLPVPENLLGTEEILVKRSEFVLELFPLTFDLGPFFLDSGWILGPYRSKLRP